jgi:hypothetical protein
LTSSISNGYPTDNTTTVTTTAEPTQCPTSDSEFDVTETVTENTMYHPVISNDDGKGNNVASIDMSDIKRV